jgi:hypothetical protein
MSGKGLDGGAVERRRWRQRGKEEMKCGLWVEATAARMG